MSTTSQTLTEGDTIALTAGATGAAGIQWYYKKGDEAPKPVDGATTASLSVAATMEYNGADIYCQFVNDAGAVTTSFCRITVNAKPAAPVTTKNPTDETVTEGGRAIFIARADGATSYLWRIISGDGTQVYDYTAARTAFPTLSISGGDSETLTLTNIPYDMNGWKVACLFKSEGGETLSGTASVTVTKRRRLSASSRSLSAARWPWMRTRTSSSPFKQHPATAARSPTSGTAPQRTAQQP